MHHGVKGMKWGVRHDPERFGSGRMARRQAKLEKYRNKLVSRSQRLHDSNSKQAQKYGSQYKDLSKGGVNSKTWQGEVDSRVRKSALKANGFQDIISKSISSEQSRYNRKEMEYFKVDVKLKAEKHEKSAKDWMKTKSDLMNMKITSSTSKKDIRNAYRSVRKENARNEIKSLKKNAGTQIGSIAGVAAGAAVGAAVGKRTDNEIYGMVATAGSVYLGQQLGRYGGAKIDLLRSKK